VSEPVHLYQVWIKPRAHGYEPGYEELRDARPAPDRLTLVASADGRDGSLTIQQDAEVWLGKLAAGVEVAHPIDEGRGVWVQVLRGAATVGGAEGGEGDGFAIEGEPSVILQTGAEGAEVLLFDLP
jgi:redox-sensitive bicupin YhaK (pirin superfamily)